MAKINPGIQGGLSLDSDPDHIKQYYKQWAEKYDTDVSDGGYQAATQIVDCIQNLPNDSQIDITLDSPDIRIHDAGCGTGLVGEALHTLGYTNIDGSDLSTAMIEQAKQRNIYRELTGDVDLTLPVRTSWKKTYDLVVCCGVFTCGHVPPDTLLQLLNMTKKGGIVILSTRTSYYDEAHYQQVNDQVIQAKKAKLLLSVKNAPYTHDGLSHYWNYVSLE